MFWVETSIAPAPSIHLYLNSLAEKEDPPYFREQGRGAGSKQSQRSTNERKRPGGQGELERGITQRYKNELRTPPTLVTLPGSSFHL